MLMKSFSHKWYFLVVFCFICTMAATAQKLQWAKRIGSTGLDAGNKIQQAPDGSIYTTGTFNGTVDFDEGPGVYNLTAPANGGLFLLKTDAEGNFIWAKHVVGNFTLNANGEIYIFASISDTVDVDPGPGVFTVIPVAGIDLLIEKLDVNGNFVWAKQIDATNSAGGRMAKTDALGNVYVAGTFNGSGDFDPGAGVTTLTSTGTSDVFIMKFDANGNFAWAKSMGGAGDNVVYDLAVDAPGNLYFTGKFQNSFDFDPGAGVATVTTNGGYEIFIAKFNTTGGYVWAKTIGGISGDVGYAIELDDSGYVYTAGNFARTADFDPGADTFNISAGASFSNVFICKLNNNGGFVWARGVGGPKEDVGWDLAVDAKQNVYTIGTFSYTADFDPGPLTYNFSSVGTIEDDLFISKLDRNGNFLWALAAGDSLDELGSGIMVDNANNVYVTGLFRQTLNFDTANSNGMEEAQQADVFIAKFSQKGVIGYVYNDINKDCSRQNSEIGLSGRRAIITPGDIVVQTSRAGNWYIDSLPAGNYTIQIDTLGQWDLTCPLQQAFTVVNPDSLIYGPSFGFASTQPCALPDISVQAPVLRWCFSGQNIYVKVCNKPTASGTFKNGQVILELDSLLVPLSASRPYTALGNNKYRFDIDSLNPDVCTDFFVTCQMSCNAIIGKTMCMNATLLPVSTCSVDTTPLYPAGVAQCHTAYDGSEISVKGICNGAGNIHFTVSNTGSNMGCYTPVRIYTDGYLVQSDSVKLDAGDSAVYDFSGDGKTWRIEADQHPRHPGLFFPSTTVERCSHVNNWTPGLVNVLPQDDADPSVDVFCGVITGSHDPNDKTGYPLGVSQQHLIQPNTPLEYVIRFQNTGTDTAFTVVVRDTLSEDLDIFSVVSGVSSHKYIFRMYGPRVLEWSFYNILLPDSNANEPASNGFVTFSVKQAPNLADNTVIANSAAIYFDFNEAVITNTYRHTISRAQTRQVGILSQTNTQDDILVYPNPASSLLFIASGGKEVTEVSIYNTVGTLVTYSKGANAHTIDISELANGVYFAAIKVNGIVTQKKWIKM
jgi:uncharacterized repeat protein (TIGR01451 family)